MNKTISIKIYTSNKKSGKTEVIKHTCSLTDECPLFKNRKCVRLNIFPDACPYGKTERFESPLQKSKKYKDFMKEWEEEKNKIDCKVDGYYYNCLAKIGGYIYLPYNHMNHLDGKKHGIPFINYSHVFSSGSGFMEFSNFTVETILKIKNLRPMAIMGGEITQYQKEELPKFFFHLRHFFPDLYKEASKRDSSIPLYADKIKMPEKLVCPLKYIPSNKLDGYSLCGYKVKMWDGTTVYLKTDYISLSHAKSKDNEYEIRFNPDIEETKVTIEDDNLKKELCLSYPELL